MTAIALSRIHFPITTLGPGNRIGIWLQGCSIRCPGCISADTWATGSGTTTVQDVLSAIAQWLPYADGVTVSGGEPFDQPEALKELLAEMRSRIAADILVFSGYSLEAIAVHLDSMTGLIDALISDPYLIEASQTLALRGSDNQRLNVLTPLGNAKFAAYQRTVVPLDRKFDLMMDGKGQIWMAGIPARDDFKRLTAILSAQNHKIITTQDRSVRASRNQTND
ncbi:4Fe-4S single cluster domain-containing protein [Rhizobium mongolense]|uniref:Anaerobic ribonucleoside-triphosphate reductase activating protein n=2 Tax=Rhizobium mongolense TaxID=57676 RepID=A0ABR6IN50_9HYPH|nr:4Fe-4S single cluster domain-containing protein [Rhizobium mongolense]MBB4229318.1 anaerobic ribonucleoside-triphosphate reductase activating protein [Rhizobium mongolense]TVZ63134.1 anaerobic ribonucleoside-triphosphate reductase activating protein [Rhizobium mongolense USDA 1844]